MTQKYLLPCKACGVDHPIQTSQAGEAFLCQCGANVQAPTLRAIRSLKEDPGSAPTKTRSWSVGQGVAFAVALCVALAGALAAGAVKREMSYYSTEKPEMPDVSAQFANQIDNMPPSELIVAFRMMEGEGLGEYREPFYVVHRKIVARMTRAYVAGLAAAGVGLLAALGVVISSFFTPSPKLPPHQNVARASSP